jgi:ABC-type transport system involved in multi-copper enzyme maturation permease subunit
MNKTLALLLDSYRELNSKKLFWITLILSAVVVAAMACVGIAQGAPFASPGSGGADFGDPHITFFGWKSPFPAAFFNVTDAPTLYKSLFSWLGVGFWLSFIGTILGLVSTAGLFPDFMAGGSIDLYLSKPISRLRLFITKYIGGLLFVTLQMTVFAAASFLLLGIRGHSWEPAVFLSIPLVVLMFSYLFSFCVLLGVMTRSTIAALMLTILFWFILWAAQKAETVVTALQTASDLQHKVEDHQLERYRAKLPRMPETRPAGMSAQPAVSFRTDRRGGEHVVYAEPQTKSETQARIDEITSSQARRTQTLDRVALIIQCVQAPLPKTSATIDLLDRELIKRAKLPPPDADSDANDPEAVQQEFARRREAVSGWFIIGTSLGFELVVLVIAGWRFCSRDY